MKCYECKWLDRSVVLTSSPPQYRCTLGFGAHYADHECEYDFMPIVRCKDCKHQEFYYKDAESFFCKETGMVNMHLDDGDGEFWCKYGERKQP